jgi:hypothetical protein
MTRSLATKNSCSKKLAINGGIILNDIDNNGVTKFLTQGIEEDANTDIQV